MARVRVQFKDHNLSQKESEGYGYQELTLAKSIANFSSFDPAPTIVCLYDSKDKAAMNLISRNVFGQENVGIGAKKFNLLKINVNRIKNEELKKSYGRVTPSYKFFDAKGKSLATVRGKVTAPAIQKAMKAAFESTYATGYNGYLSEYRKFLNKLDQIESKRGVLKLKRNNLARKSAAKAARGDREIAMETAVLDKEEQKLLKFEEKILAKIKLRKSQQPVAELALR